MQRHFNIRKWMLTAWLMLLGCTASYGYTTYHTAPANTNVYSTAVAPTYQFHTTSMYNPSIGSNSSSNTFTPLADNPYAGCASRPGIRKSGNPWDEDDPDTGGSNEIGVVDTPVPIGSPLLVLLALAVGYAIVRFRRKCQTAK